MSTVVVFVHGLWLAGHEAAWLRRKVALELSAESRQFTYPSVTANVTANAASLAKVLSEISADTLHLVGHSLGGLVILKMFADASADARLEAGRTVSDSLSHEARRSSSPALPGRIVLLGSPVQGSRAAQSLARLPFGKKLMGLSIDEEVLTPRVRHWDGSRELGVIAGDLAFGLGRVVGSFAEPNDGTVLVKETQLEGATDHRVLRVSHTGMLFSAEVAHQTALFLRTGRFEH